MATGTASDGGRAGRIECYVDIASFFSYIAVLQLVEMEDLLRQHGVQVDIYPVLIAAINAGSGNKPPWTLPAKATYLANDTYHAKLLVGLDPVTTQAPPDLFSAARTQVPNRALTYISEHFPPETYRAALLGLFAKFWTVTTTTTTSGPGGNSSRVSKEADQAARDLTTPEKVRAALSSLPPSPSPSQSDSAAPGGSSEDRLFTPEQVSQIIKAAETPEYKTKLKSRTEEVLKKGAFGAPWFWITPPPSSSSSTTVGPKKDQVKGEPVFGSDRWHVIFDILGLPYTKLALQPPQSGKSKL